MRHQCDDKKFGLSASHRRAMFRNMAESLVLQGRIRTTIGRAKELRRIAERLITIARDGSITSRRRASEILRTPTAVQTLFTDLVPRFKDRNGGYTRILRLSNPRAGDGAQLVFIEYLGYKPVLKGKKAKAQEKEKSEKDKSKSKEAKAKKKTEANIEAKELVAPGPSPKIEKSEKSEKTPVKAKKAKKTEEK